MSYHVDFRGPLGKVKTLADGGLRVYARLARTGIQTYTYSDGRTVRENRPESEVFAEDSLDTFRGAALTVQHPTSKVNPASWRASVVGHVSDTVAKDGNFVGAELYIKDADTIKRIQSGELVEISCGYDCQMVPHPGRTDSGEEFDASQAKIKINHVALGPANWGRAGRDVRLYLDSDKSESAIIGYSETPREDSTTMTDEEKKAKAEADKKEAEARKAAAEAEAKKAEEVAVEKAAAEAEAKAKEAAAVAPAPEPGTTKEPGNIDSADAVKFDALVDERLEVLDSARKVLGSDYSHKGKSTAQIRREAVESKGVKCDGRSDEYILGRFEVLVEEAIKQDAADSALAGVRTEASKIVDKKDMAEEARDRMTRENAEAWKKKGKK